MGFISKRILNSSWIFICACAAAASCTTAVTPPASPDTPVATATIEEANFVTPASSPTETVVVQVSPTAQKVSTAAPTPLPPTLQPPPPSATPPSGMSSQIPTVSEGNLLVADQLGGVPHALKVEGPLVYAGFGPRLLIIDVSDPGNPTLVGKSEPLPDLIYDIDVVGPTAYLAVGRDGLRLMDVSDPANIALIDSGESADLDQFAAQEVTIANGYAYLKSGRRMDGATNLVWFDLTNPTQPGQPALVSVASNSQLLVTDELIVEVARGETGIRFRDINDPAIILGKLSSAGNSYASQAVVFENILTVAEAGGPESKVRQFDITDPSQPAAVGDPVPMSFFLLNELVTNGRALFAGGTFGEFGHCSSQLNAVALSDGRPQADTLTMDPENCLTAMEIQEDILYLAGRSGLQLYDVSDASQPVLLSLFSNPDGFHGADGLAVRQEAVYLVLTEGRGSAIATLDLSKSEPAVTNGTTLLQANSLLDLFINGDTLTAAAWMGGLSVLDITDPLSPQLVRQPAEGEMYPGSIHSTKIHGDFLFTPIASDSGANQMALMDMSDKTAPTPAAVIDLPNNGAEIASITFSGDLLALLSYGNETWLYLYDIADPRSPQLVGELKLPYGSAAQIEALGSSLYAVGGPENNQEILVVDIAYPQTPSLLGRWTLPAPVHALTAGEHNRLYMTSYEGDLWALDAADRLQPRVTDHLSLAGGLPRIRVQDGTIFAATYDGGLYLIQTEQTSP